MFRDMLVAILPEQAKRIIRPIRNRFVKKSSAALSYWQGRYKFNKGKFNNSHYEMFMLAMAEEHNDNFLKGKIVADFGCGPCGSLVWARSASLRIGIDVLADRYADEFTNHIISHGMIYLKSTENVIPLPSNFLDIMFTLNAMDHVDNFPAICSEIIRILKPGGEFIGSFNLEGHATPCEPQQLNEKVIKEHLLDSLKVQSYRITKAGPEGDDYAHFFDGQLSYETGEEGYLWVRAMKL